LNTSVVAFAAVLIFGGIVLGVDLIVVLGVFLLIAGLLASPKKQSKIPVSKTNQPSQPSRVSAQPSYSPHPKAEPPMAAQMPMQAQQPAYTLMSGTPMPSPTLQSGYAPPLFPTAIFPTLSLASTYRQPESKEKQPPPSERDELLEFGLLLAVFKLVSG
jgi:hypothetical protein